MKQTNRQVITAVAIILCIVIPLRVEYTISFIADIYVTIQNCRNITVIRKQWKDFKVGGNTAWVTVLKGALEKLAATETQHKMIFWLSMHDLCCLDQDLCAGML